MKINLAVVCDYAIVDQYGKLSILGIFEHLWIPQFPTVHPRAHLVLRLKGKRTEIGEQTVKIRLVDEDGQEIISGDGRLDFAEPPAGVTEIEAGTVLVFDIPLQQPGRYRFEIDVGGEQASVPLVASQAPEDSPPELAQN